MKKELVAALVDASNAPGTALAPSALVIARVECPRLDPEPYIARLDAMGDAARRVVERHASSSGDMSAQCGVKALNEYLFDELGFTGNLDKYEDPRNSCLNEVLDRRTGIPITMSLVYIEVARRAGLRAEGVNFPGHFLVRVLQDLHTDDPGDGLIVDAFHGGAILNEHDCRLLLHRHMGEEAAWAPELLARATRRHILVRMLLNLKRLYVKWRSFPQARAITDLLLALSPSAVTELRDRGLLAYHMNDFPAALRDLEEYLKLSKMSDSDEDLKKDNQQVWEHVKALRRRVASLN